MQILGHRYCANPRTTAHNWGTKTAKKFFEGTPIRQGFSGSLGFPQHKNIREHGLSFAKLFCRPNQCQNFNPISRLCRLYKSISD